MDKIININQWERKEYYNHYLFNTPCTYSITTKIDITNLINNKLRLYPALIYCLVKTINKFDEFKTSYEDEEHVIIFDKILPSYTIFNKQSKTFSCIYSQYKDNLVDFLYEYEKDTTAFNESNKLFPQQNMPKNTISISMIPWIEIDGFNLNLKKDSKYLLPIFTLGKYFKKRDKYLISLSIQVHHAVCDGYHVGEFIKQLQNNIKNIK